MNSHPAHLEITGKVGAWLCEMKNTCSAKSIIDDPTEMIRTCTRLDGQTTDLQSKKIVCDPAFFSQFGVFSYWPGISCPKQHSSNLARSKDDCCSNKRLVLRT